MGAPDLLLALSASGIEIVAEGDLLLLRPAKALTPALRSAIRAVKTDLLAIVPRRVWRVLVPGRVAFDLACPQGCTRDELVARYHRGTVVEPA